ncbi:ZNRD2-like protein [Mya arenaria]|uniref:ZNRD2-like protein n=1 Tax=Mya arenaria TaxID=6604 RepID=A0ABY7FBN6_MYAAR|nr:ZNRD2-like protein [Mya arenaria]
MDDDYEWQPPSEAELKIIQARRERSDRISKLLGDYMLKGYKMLGICCQACSTILLQDKQGVNYCVACQELDTDIDKDDPVLCQAAARSQILEGSVADDEDRDDLSFMARMVPLSTQQHTTSHPPVLPAQQTSPVTIATASSTAGTSQSHTQALGLNFSPSVNVLCDKIKWATDELRESKSVEYSIHLCQLLKTSADALQNPR